MRLFAVLILLAPFIQGTGQSGIEKKLTLDEAISAAIMNNPSLKTDSQKKELTAKVEETYYNQVYQLCTYKTLKQQAFLFHDIERVANLRYEAGDIDLLEKTTMISRINEIRTAISMLDDEMAISANKMKLLLFTQNDIVPADSVLTMYAVQKGTLQELNSTSGFIFENKKETLEYELNKYFKKIQYFHQVALDQADTVAKINRTRFEGEEIDYTEYVTATDEAYKIRLEYLQTLNKYNQTAIQLELYAY